MYSDSFQVIFCAIHDYGCSGGIEMEIKTIQEYLDIIQQLKNNYGKKMMRKASVTEVLGVKAMNFFQVIFDIKRMIEQNASIVIVRMKLFIILLLKQVPI
jgi:hypothetical protein